MKKYTDTPVILIGLSTGRLESCDKREVTSERAFKLAEFLHTEFLETTLDDEEMISWIIAQTMEKALRHLDAHDGGRGRLTSITPSTKDSKKKPKEFSVCF
ncbi:hypothetical protein BaRGS_00035704 [Batillaria attramentaria]|uniref:Uncharacterized protein n=1 Tax=Batillaria attramentaria TaxID=370345 RepID=A0ABD0JEM9_9CAEN|nr:hypothetical protein BaRGS_010597 [Batillaria attramentaria]